MALWMTVRSAIEMGWDRWVEIAANAALAGWTVS
jgi:hypothetical protein